MNDQALPRLSRDPGRDRVLRALHVALQVSILCIAQVFSASRRVLRSAGLLRNQSNQEIEGLSGIFPRIVLFRRPAGMPPVRTWYDMTPEQQLASMRALREEQLRSNERCRLLCLNLPSV